MMIRQSSAPEYDYDYEGSKVVKMGHLKKRGRARSLFGGTSWHTRSVIVTLNKKLHYLHDKVKKGTVDIEGATVERVTGETVEGFPYCFVVTTKDGEELYLASGLSQEDTDEWVRVITGTIEGRDVLSEQVAQEEAQQQSLALSVQQLQEQNAQLRLSQASLTASHQALTNELTTVKSELRDTLANKALDEQRMDKLRQTQTVLADVMKDLSSAGEKLRRSRNSAFAPIADFAAAVQKIQGLSSAEHYTKAFEKQVFALIDEADQKVQTVFRRVADLEAEFDRASEQALAEAPVVNLALRKTVLNDLLAENEPIFGAFQTGLLSCVGEGYPSNWAVDKLRQKRASFTATVKRALEAIPQQQKITRVLCIFPGYFDAELAEERPSGCLGNMSDFRTMLSLSGAFEWVNRAAIRDEYLTDLHSFDIVAFDLCDSACSYYYMSTEQEQELISFLRTGKSVLLSHDHFTAKTNLWTVSPELFAFCGFTLSDEAPESADLQLFDSCTALDISHSVLQAPFSLSAALSSGISVSPTHAGLQTVITDAQIVVVSNNEGESAGREYLFTRIDPTYHCRVANISAGHTSSITFEEKCLLVNIFVWLSGK